MSRDTIPKDPVYMTYMYNHEDIPHNTNTPGTYRPSSNLSQTELDLQGARGVYQHFHKPHNDHTRYLTVASPTDRAAYRDLPRKLPPPWDGQVSTAKRPTSAPPSRPGYASPTKHKVDIGNATLLDNMTTLTGAPCYTVSALLEADLQDGSPLMLPEQLDPDDPDAWRVARVQTYAVPPTRVGYGEGGVRPFHQDYRHYKYYGFAGRGAKTSWAHNPKYRQTYSTTLSSPSDSTAPRPSTDSMMPPAPLQQHMGGPRRPLTPAEKALARAPEFSMHAYSAEGSPSDPAARLASMRSSRTATASGAWPGSSSPHKQTAPFMEPYNETVNIHTRQPLPGQRAQGDAERARVTTYRQLSSAFELTHNLSPNHGSQSPWTQRYGHYKYNGFAGKGATSSWARNPKCAQLYD